MIMKFAPAIAAVPLLLAACSQEAEPQDAPIETGGEAAGDVLGGTISDDMLPLEELTSTSPRAERTQSATAQSSSTAPDDQEQGENGDEASGEADSVPAPQVELPAPAVAPPSEEPPSPDGE